MCKNHRFSLPGNLTDSKPGHNLNCIYSLLSLSGPGQADRVIELIDPNSELAKTIDKEYWVKREVEKKKYLPGNVVQSCKAAGYRKFRITEHTDYWKQENAKDPQKGFGTQVENAWYWYQNWVDKCVEYCKTEGDKYK